ncbi:MAG: glycoside hydrolase family 57 protein [Candidatus Acidulodesulfobacterium sp.]
MDSANPINVIFLWHFHQPYYKDNFTGEMLMPWTRLHATKDYYFMGSLLKKYPEIHATFNYSPSLLRQLEDYAANYVTLLKNEEFLRISNIKISELSPEDKLFIIEKFFPACSSSNNFIEKSGRFKQLYGRLKTVDNGGIEDKINLFDNQDYLDIIVLFNLLWFDPVSIAEDEFLTALKNKDKKFAEEEKDRLIKEKIPQVLNKIFPLITELAKNGQIEISASPYYHPILPLLCDTDIADFHDGIKLPTPFRHPEDADYQIKSAVDYFGDKLGYKIKGMWPSEGSVSEKALKLFMDNDINWIATDEEILENSIGTNLKDLRLRKLLYRPYVIKRNNKFLYIFFRDKGLSDLIGFKYSNYEPKAAAEDLINNLKNISLSLQNHNETGLSVVPIILDGENAWEYYKNNGYDFFNYLYENLTKNSQFIKTVTAGEYIKKAEETLKIKEAETGSVNFENGKTGAKIKPFFDIKWNADPDKYNEFDYAEIYNIPMIYPGSWINHNFRIWIGDKEDNRAWDLLSKTRDYLIHKDKEAHSDKNGTTETVIKGNENGRSADFKGAWEQIFIAEGSDYNWWYGEDRTSGIDEEYDFLYRTHLINVYKFLNETPPDEYFIPLLEGKKAIKPNLDIVSFIYPKIDGIADNYFEWLGSAVFFPSILSGKAMAHTDRFIRKMQYGFNKDTFFMRFDFFKKDYSEFSGKVIIIKFINTSEIEVKVEFSQNKILNLLLNSSDIKNISTNMQHNTNNILKAAYDKILELSISTLALGVSPNNLLNFYAILTYKDNPLAEIERFPVNGYFETAVPDAKFELMNWIV